MIIFRYLTREILLTMSAVAGVLLLVIMGSRFIRYFANAAEGEIPANILGSLMLYHMPGFLELILPLAFFLGILLAYGQLYLNSEITVLVACGTSPNRLLTVSLVPAALVALLVGIFSLWLTPAGALHNELVLEEQRSKLDFSALAPGRFQEFGSGRIAYASDVSEDGERMQEVFISERQKRSDGSPESVVTRATQGYQSVDPDTGSRYLVLEDGERYSAEAGRADAERLEFGTYAVRLARAVEAVETDSAEFATTTTLLNDASPEARAQLQWRLGAPLMVFVLTLLAQPLSRVNPRQGRFAKLLPAIFLYVAYLSLLLAAMDAIGSGSLPAVIGMWPIHAGFLILGLGLAFNAQRKGMSG
ncbi:MULTISPECIES: LPS export ABC transporter permease LptF [unclassified Halomonas]|uniref:LPS export ABC transporter permease LptF n=1 Tax=unclassified Halomonas TaxID=2609666 RepID=UPI001C99E490|nr:MULTISPECIES: LPS export ABC transporter permease LptF [unclassified Halomonas]MBR9770293.1 LPS export ABC transporter permease LptF [Gammaproteobacteria bacterium]MBY5940024.1 LPS export ABC transporter permease LptF [Halomonas sp. DP5N14-9]MCJ8284358.1 LPS export ABC transporter permease LptF [Halomonas sp.]MCO7217226.1 LPS export ABC transporter permease LptF [Halomonas sp. OfavH-34-E]NQY69412.1 LPS export ABC transporter permease LptF [Halomonas sp.]